MVLLTVAKVGLCLFGIWGCWLVRRERLQSLESGFFSAAYSRCCFGEQIGAWLGLLIVYGWDPVGESGTCEDVNEVLWKNCTNWTILPLLPFYISFENHSHLGFWPDCFSTFVYWILVAPDCLMSHPFVHVHFYSVLDGMRLGVPKLFHYVKLLEILQASNKRKKIEVSLVVGKFWLGLRKKCKIIVFKFNIN